MPNPEPENQRVRRPSFWEAFRFWLKLGFIGFGGPTGQLAIMHTELVDRKRWISESRFLHAVNFCMLLPGPEAQQTAIYIGWLLHRTWGGIVAGALFVLPSAVILWVLSLAFMLYGENSAVASIFYGLQPAVIAIVAAAVFRIGGKTLKSPALWAVAAIAFAAIFFLNVPFIAIILAAAAIGWIGGRMLPSQFYRSSGHSGKEGGSPVLSDQEAACSQHSWALSLRVSSICLLLWWSPILAVGWWQGWDGILFQMGLFFSKAALVTFGGAYAILPFVAQQAVANYGWLTTDQMMIGLGLAETTPGPLIMVLQFVGFVGAWQHPGTMGPLVAATLGAAITTWATFLPCFLFVLIGAPYVEQLRGVRWLGPVLTTITAAVVGVILNLAVWFGWHVIVPKEVDWFALLAAAVFFVGIHRFKWGIIPVIGGACLLGLAHGWMGGW